MDGLDAGAQVSVPESRVDLKGRFNEYRIESTDGSVTTVAWRRFNEFKALDAALRAGAIADKPELPTATFLARYGITTTDVEDRRIHLQGYLQEVVGKAGECDALTTFLGPKQQESTDGNIITGADQHDGGASSAEQQSDAGRVLVRQRSHNIDVPTLAARSSGHVMLAGSPFAISPPDEFEGLFGDGAQYRDSDDWVHLEMSDSEEDPPAPEPAPEPASAPQTEASARSTTPPTREEQSAAADPTGARAAGGDSPTRREKKQARKDKQKVLAPYTPAVPTVVEASTQPVRRSYVAAARASVLLGETLPAEPTKVQMVAWLQRNSGATFLLEHKLNGDAKAVANARTRNQISDAYYLALVSKVDSDKLERLIFDTMDSDLDETIDRDELRYSPFEPALGQHWEQMSNGKPEVSRADWKRYVEAAKTRVGGAVGSFLADLVFDADVDVHHLLPGGSNHYGHSVAQHPMATSQC